MFETQTRECTVTHFFTATANDDKPAKEDVTVLGLSLQSSPGSCSLFTTLPMLLMTVIETGLSLPLTGSYFSSFSFYILKLPFLVLE